jgi:hypothetical protein
VEIFDDHAIWALMYLGKATDVRGAGNRWCATYTRPANENCTFATFEQCQAQVLGLGGWCRPNGVRDRWDLVQSAAPVSRWLLTVSFPKFDPEGFAL